MDAILMVNTTSLINLRWFFKLKMMVFLSTYKAGYFARLTLQYRTIASHSDRLNASLQLLL
jgi:hypothetical protein